MTQTPGNAGSMPLGIIEGFFGHPWSWAERRSCADFLGREGFDFYLYAPKSDPWLRRHWQSPWPEEDWAQLVALRRACADAGVRFGLGLSPLELYREPAASSRRQLADKLRQMNALEPDLLGLLFDDMRGDLPALARRQAELAQVALETTRARQLILCPTYYSPDPLLEKVFGQRPPDYWPELGEQLPVEIEVFWTGPRVCSNHYPAEHLAQVSQWLQRKPFLWDNYPVNDSAEQSPFLRLMTYPKGHSQLTGQVAGHAANPMNQPWLSQIPLSSLPLAYRQGPDYEPEQAFARACQRLLSPPLAERLHEDQPLLQGKGLERLSEQERQWLTDRYRPLAQTEPQARELLDWLAGRYAFDPACLTA